MAHSKEAHAKMNGMGIFHKEHFEKKMSDNGVSDLKYCGGEMNAAEELKAANDGLASYAKKHKAKH